MPGDTVTVAPGLYFEALRTVRDGLEDRPIRIRASGPRGSATVMTPGRVLRVAHMDIVVEGLAFDGQYAEDDTVSIASSALRFTLRNAEVRRSSKDLIDMAAPTGVLIEGCLIHHALNATDGRTDAHGIVAGAVIGLTIRDTEIHTFSGDAFQVDPGRAVPGWNRVTIERTKMWLEPLVTAENGFPAGTTPGENGIDTKASPLGARSSLVLRDVTAWGFRNGLIGNMAAFNLKENVDVVADRVTVFDSEIAFRVRGAGADGRSSARVTVLNTLIHDVETAFRYEEQLESFHVWHTTIGAGVRVAFRGVQAAPTSADVRNTVVLGTGQKPVEMLNPSNALVGPDAFIDVHGHDYRPSDGSLLIAAGAPLEAIRTDRTGAERPPGVRPTIGAFERPAAAGR